MVQEQRKASKRARTSEVSNQDSGPQLKCNICGKTYKTKKAMLVHGPATHPQSLFAEVCSPEELLRFEQELTAKKSKGAITFKKPSEEEQKALDTLKNRDVILQIRTPEHVHDDEEASSAEELMANDDVIEEIISLKNNNSSYAHLASSTPHQGSNFDNSENNGENEMSEDTSSTGGLTTGTSAAAASTTENTTTTTVDTTDSNITGAEDEDEAQLEREIERAKQRLREMEEKAKKIKEAKQRLALCIRSKVELVEQAKSMVARKTQLEEEFAGKEQEEERLVQQLAQVRQSKALIDAEMLEIAQKIKNTETEIAKVDAEISTIK